MRAVPVGRTAAPFVEFAYLMTNGQMCLRPMLGQTLDRRRNLLISSNDDCDVSRRGSPVAHARAPGPYADTYAVAVNLVVVECDGSRPGRPDLRGGEQARRHRAACNRGHGLLRCCVELRYRWLRSDQPTHYRARSRFAQIGCDHRFATTAQCRYADERVARISKNWIRCSGESRNR